MYTKHLKNNESSKNSLEMHIVEIVKTTGKLDAVKWLNREHGLSLVEAKQKVDAIWEE